MKIPALRAHIGDWTYYVTTLTFEQVELHVSRIDDELHKSETLKDAIQRSITNNFISIRDYILNQRELFFNSLVLAVYDDYPEWREIEFTYGGKETFQMGILDFPGHHKIFPVDGQHRVEGIKAAVKQNPELAKQRISVVLVGHKNDAAGMQRTRRLFSTLNRYAKPVKLDDIIALDEDDSVAIATRYLLEEYDLFADKRVVIAKQKAIPANNKDAITSIITLYQANLELLKTHYQEKYGTKLTGKKLDEYLKVRRVEEELNDYQNFCVNFWDAFKSNLRDIADYLDSAEQPADRFRNNENGGNLLFRPIGFVPFVKASLIVRKRTDEPFDEILKKFNKVNFNLNSKPWHYVAWNPTERKMIMGSDLVIQLLLIYLYDEELLEQEELQKLRTGYASKIAYRGDDLTTVLDGIKLPATE